MREARMATTNLTVTFRYGPEWAKRSVRILEAACAVTGHWRGCRMLQQRHGWPTARLYLWLHDIAFPEPLVSEPMETGVV